MNLQVEFLDIRSKYFPRWDRPGNWRIQWGSFQQRRGHTGYCDTVAKIIFLDSATLLTMAEFGKRAFIIHEICHDTGAALHRRPWAIRMEAAAKRADDLHEEQVAECLREDVYSYFGRGLEFPYTRSGMERFVQVILPEREECDSWELIKRTAEFFGYRPSKIQRDFGEVISMARDQWLDLTTQGVVAQPSFFRHEASSAE